MELYVHIPFCVRKCNYCDFLSFAGYGCDADEKHHSYIFRYTSALCKELEEVNRLFEERSPDSVFIGGGTPSVLDEQNTEKILKSIKENVLFKEGQLFKGIKEYTVECNPGTVTREKLELYREYGVNRLSFGLQSADNRILKRLGRIHTFEEFLESYRLARECGFENINIDLISSVPEQTVQNWKDTLDKVIGLSPEHISAYSLILEEGTPLYEEYLKDPKNLNLPDEDTERDIYRITGTILREHGYNRYEISNYAKTGYECRHNIGYWTGEEYLGIGIGAASYLSEGNYKRLSYNGYAGDKNCMIRFKNTEDPEEYTEHYLVESIGSKSIRNVEETLLEKDMMAEFCILGLRMTKGISCKDFNKRFGKDIRACFGEILDKYLRSGLLEISDDRILFTERGLDLSNMVLCEFVE